MRERRPQPRIDKRIRRGIEGAAYHRQTEKFTRTPVTSGLPTIQTQPDSSKRKLHRVVRQLSNCPQTARYSLNGCIGRGIARDPLHSAEDNCRTVRIFDIDDVRSSCKPNRVFRAGTHAPSAPARSIYLRTDPSETGSLPIAAAIAPLRRLTRERKLLS